jgi:hypothetical protein
MRGAGAQHGSHINSSLQFFFSNEPCKKIHVGNAVSGTWFTSDKGGKTIGRGTMDAEINNVIYMVLYSGPKMAHDKYKKTNVARSIDRDSTVSDLLNINLQRNIMLVWEQLRFDMLIPIAQRGNKKNCPYVVNNLPIGPNLFDFLPCWPPAVRGWNDTVTWLCMFPVLLA